MNVYENAGAIKASERKEFPPGMHIEKEIADLDTCSGRLTGVLNLVDLAPRDFNECANLILTAAGGELEPGDAGYARQGLTTEAHRGDCSQVSAFPDLARGMALEAEQSIGTIHSASVIGDTDQSRPTSLKLHGDASGARINGVLHEFLDHRGWALHHFTSSHLACKDIGK
jgi:hypothetical protein